MTLLPGFRRSSTHVKWLQYLIVVGVTSSLLALGVGFIPACAMLAPPEPQAAPLSEAPLSDSSSDAEIAHAVVSANPGVEPAARESEQLKFYPGNTAELKIDGPSTFHAMFEDIDASQNTVHIETYILEDDDIGQELARRLYQACERGVKVRLLVDAFGSMNLSETFVAQLESHDIEFQKFHPIDPSEDPRVWRSNNRDHRKLLIIDDRVAYTGGLNFSEVYKEGSSSVRRREPETDGAWRDTQVRISGPAVMAFQRYFLAMWNRDLPVEQHVVETRQSPGIRSDGDVEVAVVASVGGDDVEFNIYSTFTRAIEESKHRVWITQAYFAPNEAFIDTLKVTAIRGVDVRLLLPGISDSTWLIRASRSSYQELLESGVRIYERKASVLHAKTMVVDGVWSSVGSANFDYRSFVHNYELNAVLVGRDFGNSMEQVFAKDLDQSQEITLAAWKERSIVQRIEEWLGNLVREWL